MCTAPVPVATTARINHHDHIHHYCSAAYSHAIAASQHTIHLHLAHALKVAASEIQQKGEFAEFVNRHLHASHAGLMQALQKR